MTRWNLSSYNMISYVVMWNSCLNRGIVGDHSSVVRLCDLIQFSFSLGSTHGETLRSLNAIYGYNQKHTCTEMDFRKTWDCTERRMTLLDTVWRMPHFSLISWRVLQGFIDTSCIQAGYDPSDIYKIYIDITLTHKFCVLMWHKSLHYPITTWYMSCYNMTLIYLWFFMAWQQHT